MVKKVFHLTENGKRDLEKELEELNRTRPLIAERIATARAFGDLSENAEYSAAQDERSRTERRIHEIENILENHDIIEEIADGKVGLGDSVVLLSDGTEQEFQVVGAVEADPAAGKISNHSPLGEQLLGKKVGDTVTVKTPKSETSYKIVKINE